MSENLSTIISQCYKASHRKALSDDEIGLIDSSLYHFRGVFDNILNNPQQTLNVLFSSEADSDVLYYPIDIIELRKVFTDGYLGGRCPVALFSYKVAKKWLVDYPVLFGIRVDKKDIRTYGGFAVYKYDKLNLAGSLERMVIDTDLVNDEMLASIERITKDEGVKADLIRTREPAGLPQMVVANYYDIKTAENGGFNIKGLGTWLSQVGIRDGKKLTWPTGVPLPSNWDRFSRQQNPFRRALDTDPQFAKELQRAINKGPVDKAVEWIKYKYNQMHKMTVQPVINYLHKEIKSDSQVESKVFDLLMFAGITTFSTDAPYPFTNDITSKRDINAVIKETAKEFKTIAGTDLDVEAHKDTILKFIETRYTEGQAKSDIAFEAQNTHIEIFGGPMASKTSEKGIKDWIKYAVGTALKKVLSNRAGHSICYIMAKKLEQTRLISVAKKLDGGFCCCCQDDGKEQCGNRIIEGSFVEVLEGIAPLINMDKELNNWIAFLRNLQSMATEEAMAIANGIRDKINAYHGSKVAQINMDNVLSDALALVNSIDFNRIGYLSSLNEQAMDGEINLISDDVLFEDKVALFYGTDTDQFYQDMETMRNFAQLMEIYPQIENLESFQQPQTTQPMGQPEATEQIFNIQDYAPVQDQQMQQQLAANVDDAYYKLATTSIGLGPDSGLEGNGHGYEGGMQQMEAHEGIMTSKTIGSRYKLGDRVQFRPAGLGDGSESKGEVVKIHNNKVTIKWDQGKYAGKSHTLPLDSVLLDRYVQII